METETRHLIMTDGGRVYLRRGPDDDDEFLGDIEDIDACPDGLIAEWRWLQDEMEDRRRFADGCRWTAECAWLEGRGDYRRW